MDAVSYSKASSAYKLAGTAVAGLSTKADLTTSGVLVPVGTTATRPTLGAGVSAIRYNTDLGKLEEWNGTGWFNVSADITVVALKGTDTVVNILAKTGMVAEDLWIASDTLDGYVYDGSAWINIGPLQGPQGIQGIQGETGLTGNGVASVTKTATVGLVDTYTITFTDTTTTTFNVTNGLNGTNGVDGQDIDHITRTSGTGAAGTTDTYTAYADLAETQILGSFNVYNGADGLGVGDMLKATYDPTNINASVFDQDNMVNGINNKNYTAAEQIRLANTSGTNTGDETVSTIKTKLGITTLSGSNTGDQDLSGYSVITHNHTGVYEPADATILKDADIGSTVQAYNANTTVAGNTFNGNSQLVQTTVDGKLPAIDGSLLTGIATGSEHYSQELTPTGMSIGATWYVPSTSKTYMYVNDGTNNIWIDTSPVNTGVTKEYVDTGLAGKADVATTYNKVEIAAAIASVNTDIKQQAIAMAIALS